jgi:hypothetical protein
MVFAAIERFEIWRKRAESELPSEVVRAPYASCHTEGHTFAPCGGEFEAYTFQDHASLDDATAFTGRLIHCYDEAMWKETTWDDFLRDLDGEEEWETKERLLLARLPELWDEFVACKPLLRKVFVLGYLGCGTWEHSHACFVFELAPARFVVFRVDINGDMLWNTVVG